MNSFGTHNHLLPYHSLLLLPRTPSRNQPNLLPRRCTMRSRSTLTRTSLTATVGVNSSNHFSSARSRVLMPLRLHPMEHVSRLQERLVSPTRSRNHTDSSQAIIINIPRAPRRQPNHRSLRRMPHTRGISTRRLCELTSITSPKLKITNQSTLRNLTQRNNVTHISRSFPAQTNLLPLKSPLSRNRIA